MVKQKLNTNQLNNTYQRSFQSGSQTTGSTTFVAPTPAQTVTVTVGASGAVQVGIFAGVGNTTVGAYNIIAISASGTNAITATDDTGTYWRSNSGLSAGAGENTTGKVFLLTGLTPGVTVFALNIRTTVGTMAAERKEIWALAL